MKKPYHTSMTGQILYQFRRQYGGGPITIYRIEEQDVDFCTGEIQSEQSCVEIACVIVLPASVTAKFVQNISKISADKRFVWGGTYDVTTRGFIVDRRDAPNLELREDDWIVWKGQRYEIKNFFLYEEDAGWVIIGDHVRGDVGCQMHKVFAEDTLLLGENHAQPNSGTPTLDTVDTCQCNCSVKSCCGYQRCCKPCLWCGKTHS